MLDWWNDISLGAFDFLLGRLLAWSPDAALLVVAIGSGAILTLVRLFTTNQDLLRRAARDKKRLKELKRQARAQRDREAVKRYRATASMIAMKTAKYEPLPLLVAIVPIAMLATWCFARLQYHPPRPGEEVAVCLYTPISAAGEPAHVVPQDGLEADRWVQPVEPVDDQEPACGMATWKLKAAVAEPHRLTVRVKRDSFEHGLAVGGWTYSRPVIDHGSGFITELKMRPVKLFNLVPGIPWIHVPPWLVGYLIVVIPTVVLIRRVFRIR